MYNKTDFLKVYFTKQIDSESKGIEIYESDIATAKDVLLAHGQLNLCTNMAHVQILEKHRNRLKDVSNYEIEEAIEQRETLGNRILIK